MVKSNANGCHTEEISLQTDFQFLDDYLHVEKSGTILDQELIDKKPWIKDIKELELFSHDWHCYLIFMLETDSSFFGTVQLINNALDARKRRAVRIITEEHIHQMALDNCFKAGKRTPFSALCEAVKREGGYKFRNNISTHLLAYMIKYMLLFEKKAFLKEECNKYLLNYRNERRYRALALHYDHHKETVTTKDLVEDVAVADNGESKEENEPSIEKIKENVSKDGRKEVKNKGSKNIKEEKPETGKKGKKNVVGANNKQEKPEIGKKGNKKVVGANNKQEKPGTGKKGKKNIADVNKYGKEDNIEKGKKLEAKEKEKQRKLIGDHDQPQHVDTTKTEDLYELLEKDFSAKYLRKESNVLKFGERGEKLDTSLHIRGDVNRDIYEFDDSPPYGPNLYVFISSFKTPELPELMNSILIPFKAFIFIGCKTMDPCLQTENIITLCDQNEEHQDEDADVVYEDEYMEFMKNYGNYFSFLSVMSIHNYAEERQITPMAYYSKLKRDLFNFYDRFFLNVISKRTYEQSIMTKYVPDISQLDFCSKSWLRKLLYILAEDVTYLGYYFHKVNTLYRDYIRLMPAKNVKAKRKPPTELDMKLYNCILNSIPNDLMTIPLILDTLIAQVCYNCKSFIGYRVRDYLKNPEQQPKAEEKLEKSNPLKQTIKTLRDKYFQQPKPLAEPSNTFCMHYNDMITFTSYNFKVWGPFRSDRTNHILQIFFERQWKKLKERYKPMKSEPYHYLNLLKSCKYLKINDAKTVIDILLSMVALEIKQKGNEEFVQYGTELEESPPSMSNSNVSCIDTSIDTNYQTLMEALNNFELNIRQQRNLSHTDDTQSEASTVCEQEEMIEIPKFIEEILNKLQEGRITRILSNINYFEELPKRICLPTLWNIYEQYNIIETDYVPIINKVLFTCYNGSTAKVENGILPSHMCLRDFYKYGMNELKQWCNERELEYYRLPLSTMFVSEIDKLKDHISDPIQPTKITKHIEITAEDFDYPSRCKQMLDPDDAAVKKVRPVPLNYSNFKKKNVEIQNKIRQKYLTKSPIPILYNLGRKRAYLSTSIRQYLFTDSSLVTLKSFNETFLPSVTTMDISIFGHHLIYHTPLYTRHKPKQIIFTHSSGMQFSFVSNKLKKPTLESKSNLTLKPKSKTNRKSKGKPKEIKKKKNLRNKSEPINKKKLLHYVRLKILKNSGANVKHPSKIRRIKDAGARGGANFECQFSLPNGLHVENVRSIDGKQLYVKQYYLSSTRCAKEQEKCRLNLNDGSSIKLMPDNTVEIYYPCGRFIKYCRIRKLAKFSYRREKARENEANKNGNKDKFNEKRKKHETRDLYYLVEPDGRCYKVINKVRHLILENQTSEYNDIFKDIRTVVIENGQTFTFNNSNIQTVEFLDGTRITSEAYIEKKEVFCQWTLSELKRWFIGDWNLLANNDKYLLRTSKQNSFYRKYKEIFKQVFVGDSNHKKHEPGDYSNPTLDLAEDGYLWVTITNVFTEHPCFVTTMRLTKNPDKILYRLPHNIVLTKHRNGCFDMKVGRDMKLLLRKYEIVLEKYNNRKLFQRSIIWYRIFDDRLRHDNRLYFHSADKIGNWMTTDINLNVDYNIVTELEPPEDNDSLCKKCKTYHRQVDYPKYILEDSRRLILNSDYSGIELLHSNSVEEFKQLLANHTMKCKAVEDDPFIVNVYMIGVDINCAKWRMDYLDMNSDGLYNFPSTYGNSWIYPYSLKTIEKSDEIPTFLFIRFIHEFIYENLHELFTDIIKVFNSLTLTDSNRITPSLLDRLSKCNFQQNFQNREQPKSMMAVEATILRNTLYNETSTVIDLTKSIIFKNPITTQQVQQPCKRKFLFMKKSSLKYFKKKARDTLASKFLPYFNTATGIAFLMIDYALNNAFKFIDMADMRIDIKTLMEKPMEQLTESDLSQIQLFLEMYRDRIWFGEIDIKDVISASLELADIFPTMRDALEFKIQHKSGATQSYSNDVLNDKT